MTTYALGFLAGVLTIINPCVLPLLPIVVASAAGAHRFGPLALAGGLIVSFVGVGLFVATIGFSIGLDAELFSSIAGVMLIALGLVLVSSTLQQRLALAGSGLGSMADGWMQKITPEGWQGQAAIGLLLGVVWVPCVGPTLGAASIMAARGENLGQVAITMALFGLGASLPLVLIGSLSRELRLRWRGRIAATGRTTKVIFGMLVILVGLGILTGVERDIQTWLIAHTPQWLLELGTRY